MPPQSERKLIEAIFSNIDNSQADVNKAIEETKEEAENSNSEYQQIPLLTLSEVLANSDKVKPD